MAEDGQRHGDENSAQKLWINLPPKKTAMSIPESAYASQDYRKAWAITVEPLEFKIMCFPLIAPN